MTNLRPNYSALLFAVIFLLPFSLLNACATNEDNKRNTIIEYYEDGKIKSVFRKKEKPSGTDVYEYYYRNQALKLKASYSKDGKEGWEEQYDSLGGKISSVHYLKNKQNGKAYWYNASGGLESRSDWVDDKQVGESLFYFPNGIVRKYYVKDSLGKTFYILNQDIKGNVINEEGVVFSPWIFVKEKKGGTVQSSLLVNGASVELGESEINTFVAIPPETNTRLYCIVRNDSNYIDTVKAVIENNTAVLRIYFSGKGNYSILFRGELWKDNDLIKTDTLTKYIAVK